MLPRPGCWCCRYQRYQAHVVGDTDPNATPKRLMLSVPALPISCHRCWRHLYRVIGSTGTSTSTLKSLVLPSLNLPLSCCLCYRCQRYQLYVVGVATSNAVAFKSSPDVALPSCRRCQDQCCHVQVIVASVVGTSVLLQRVAVFDKLAASTSSVLSPTACRCHAYSAGRAILPTSMAAILLPPSTTICNEIHWSALLSLLWERRVLVSHCCGVWAFERRWSSTYKTDTAHRHACVTLVSHSHRLAHV